MTTPPTAAALAAEDFLRTHHNENPGRQSEGCEELLTADGRTSYQVIADRVAGARRVLDLGCADGMLLQLLAEAGAETLAGIDLSEGELAFARRRPALADADLRCGRAQQLPFSDNAYDAVVSHMAFMLMSDVEQVAAEVARVLVPGGVFSVGVGGGAVEGEARELFLKLARPYFRAQPDAARTPPLGDRRARNREGLDEILVPHGFEPVSWEPIIIDPRGTPERVWEVMAFTLYEMTDLGEEETTELRSRFLAESQSIVGGDGQLPCGMRINHATARYTGLR
ncbi:class I SAM-dependent methyltransferase [Longispora albida]|uniref:class I SAM-dependent methyltransferase n=1 Tax=Longispora albida TaxID=203523 RepID=UPI0003644D06|nr:class I SAM-dependent methyltransferase [Longispora albida]